MRLIYYLTFLTLFSIVQAKELILSKQNEKYVLKLDIANLKINLQSQWSLQNKHSWIKSQTCKYCHLIDKQTQTQQISENPNIVKHGDAFYNCSQSCFDKSQQQYGLKCIETHNKCQIIKDDIDLSIESNIMKGKLIKVKGQASANHQKFDEIQIILVEKILINANELRSESQKQQKDQHQNKIQHSFNNKIGQFSIWGHQALFESNILTKNTKGEVFIHDGLKQNKLEKQLMDIAPIDIEFEETVTLFTLSQIKLSQKITLNNPQKLTQDKQIPILPLKQGFFTLQSDNLILPQKHYQKLTKTILSTYFSTEKNKCQLKDSQVSCQKPIQFDRLQYLQLQLILNGVSVGFPFKALMTNYKGKTCNFKISPSNSTFAIGTFFLEIFAVQLLKETQNVRLHRLNNQWNKLYSKDQKYHKENFNIFWWMGTSVFYLFYYAFKILLYLALFSLFINCIYHWRKIIDWMGKIFDRIKKRKWSKEGQGQLFEEDEDLEPKDTAKLIKRFKNRKNKVFVQDQQPSINDQITTQESN